MSCTQDVQPRQRRNLRVPWPQLALAVLLSLWHMEWLILRTKKIALSILNGDQIRALINAEGAHLTMYASGANA